MKRKFLMLILIPLALGMITTSVSASTQIWTKDIGKDSGSDMVETIIPLPPSLYPFTQYKIVSTQTWRDHWVNIMILDASWNTHMNTKGVSRVTYQTEFWLWDDELGEWVYVGASSQLVSIVQGFNLLVKSGTQTSTQESVSKETFETEMLNPMTGEWMTFEYTIIMHQIVKWTNGELLFEKSWEIDK